MLKEPGMAVMKMQRITFFGLVLFSAVVSAKRDPTFHRFCDNPPNFGKGKIDEGDNNRCQLTYSITTVDDETAYNFCDTQQPFTLLSARRDGSQTICEITTYYVCQGSDVLIGDKCFTPGRAVDFVQAKESCGQGYTFHTISSGFEQKWITAFFTNYDMIWIANGRNQLKHLKYILFKDQTLHNREARLVSGSSGSLAILTRKGARAGMTAGIITSVSESTSLPTLCYREAEQLDTYFVALVQRMGNAGLSSHVYNDAEGKKRNFLIVRSLHTFETNEDMYGAGTDRLHATCKGFVKGYAASPLDFNKLSDFKELLSQEHVNIVAIPGRKTGSKLSNMDTCRKDLSFRQLRNQYHIDLPDGTQKIVHDNHWQDTMPDRTCADTPRTALGFCQKGVVDIPAIARHFVVCTYGRPYHSDTDEEAKMCHRLATYDAKTKTCRCTKPENDILETKWFPITASEQSYTRGRQCLDCSRRGEQDVAIIIDISLNINDLNHLTNLIRQFLFSMAIHNSRISRCLFSHPNHAWLRYKSAYKIDYDFIKFAEREVEQAKGYPRGEGGRFRRCAYLLYENHLKNALSNKKQIISVIGGPVKDSKEAVEYFKTLQGYGIRNKVFGIFNAEQEPNFRNLGDPEPFMIRGLDQQYPRDLFTATTMVERILTRNQCTANDEQ